MKSPHQIQVRSLNRKRFSRIGAILLTCVTSTFGIALQAKQHTSYGVSIDNFGKVNETYYRGGQPKPRDFYQLKQLGVKTIIDLQNDGKSEEADWVQSAGMKYINLPLSSKHAAGDSIATQFLRLVNDPSNLPVYVHCAGGRHRTGEMTAIYRITHDGWTADQAFNEMKQYDWYSFGGHGATKDYVYDFYARYGNNQIAGLPASNANSGTAKNR